MGKEEQDRQHRKGPVPLALHLSYSAASWMLSRNALASWSEESVHWNPLLAGSPVLKAENEALQSLASARHREKLQEALDREIARRALEFLGAIDLYQRHPYRRNLPVPETLWKLGTTELHRYPRDRRRRKGRPVLLVPSLINRATILDLRKGASFTRWLAGRGHDVYLVDWGAPGPEERGFALTDYIAGRLEAALDQGILDAKEAPVVLGYCMGGLLALALASRRQSDLAGLIVLATPWDFHGESRGRAQLVAASHMAFMPYMLQHGEFPSEGLQALFAGLDPLLACRKFLRFAKLDPESRAAEAFVALEDWLNDGVPLSAPVAAECLIGWYGENQTAKGEWRIAGRPVLPEDVSLPSLCIVPAEDRIVPPKSAQALAARLKQCQILSPQTGHIGMMASARAQSRVWEPIAQWISEEAELQFE